jgi:glycerophosphoryl diester phosphodiesterase
MSMSDNVAGSVKQDHSAPPVNWGAKMMAINNIARGVGMMKRFVEWGVDGIITDKPDLGRTVTGTVNRAGGPPDQ